MTNSTTVLLIVIVILLFSGAVLYFTNPSYYISPQNTNDANEGRTFVSPEENEENTMSPSVSHTIVISNSGVSTEKISVSSGDKVTLTFKLESGSMDTGGLEFKSSVINTGTIKPGEMKSVTFTAVKSFTITPYWPNSNVRKPYSIYVEVK